MTQQDDIIQRLRDNADIDEAEHCNPDVVALEREAADEIERLRSELSKLRAPVAKPKRAPLDDWRVQAIAECLETEWDDMTPASAEADARLIVGYLIAYEKESDQIEARHAAEPVDPVVQAMRDLRASAPVADESPLAKMAEALREKARQERQDYQDRREADRVASAPVAGEDDHDAK